MPSHTQSKFSQLQSALQLARARGASDAELGLISDRFMQNLKLSQKRSTDILKNQFADTSTQLQQARQRMKFYDEASEEGKKTKEKLDKELNYVSDYYKNNSTNTIIGDDGRPIVNIDGIQDEKIKAFHKDHIANNPDDYWDAKNNVYSSWPEQLKKINSENVLAKNEQRKTDEENKIIIDGGIVQPRIENPSTFIGQAFATVNSLFDDNADFGDLNIADNKNGTATVMLPNGKNITLNYKDKTKENLQDFNNKYDEIKRYYDEKYVVEPEHVGIIGPFNEITVDNLSTNFGGNRSYKKQDQDNLNKILGNINYKIEISPRNLNPAYRKGADFIYNITDINGNVVEKDIPISQISSWVNNLDDTNKNKISNYFSEQKIAYETDYENKRKQIATSITNEDAKNTYTFASIEDAGPSLSRDVVTAVRTLDISKKEQDAIVDFISKPPARIDSILKEIIDADLKSSSLAFDFEGSEAVETQVSIAGQDINISVDSFNKLQKAIQQDVNILNEDFLNEKTEESRQYDIKSKTDTYREQIYKKYNPLALQGQQDKETYMLNTQLEYEADKMKSVYNTFKQDFAYAQKTLKNTFKGAAKAGVGYKIIGTGIDSRVIVEHPDEDIRKYWNNVLNSKLNEVSGLASSFEANYNELQAKYNSLRNNAAEEFDLMQVANKEYNKWAVLSFDVRKSFSDFLHGVGGAIGIDYSQNILTRNQIEASYFEDALTYDQAIEQKAKGLFTLRTFAQQSSSLTVGLGLSVLTGGSSIAGGLAFGALFGLSTGGQEYNRLKFDNKQTQKIVDEIKFLEDNKDQLDPEEYKRIRTGLESNLALRGGLLSEGQILGAGLMAGLVEGTVTGTFGAFGAGSFGNISKLAKVFSKSPADDAFNALTKQGWAKVGMYTKNIGVPTIKGSLFEVLEEEIIYFGSEGSMSWITGKDFDISNWDDTAITAGMLGTKTNLVGGVNNMIKSEFLSDKTLRNQVVDIQNDLKSITNSISNLDPKSPATSEMRSMLQLRYANKVKELVNLDAGLEVDAIIAGSKDLNTLIKSRFLLEPLYKKAGIVSGDSNAVIDKKLQDYSNSLKGAEKTSFDEQLDFANSVKQDIRNKINEKLENSPKFTLDENGNAVEEGLIFEKYGKHGLAVAKKLNKANPNFKDLSAKEQLVAIHKDIKNTFQKQTVKLIKKDKAAREKVEKMVYNGKTFEETGRKRRDTKKEEFLYEVAAMNYNARVQDRVSLYANESVIASDLLSTEELANLEIEQVQNLGDIETRVWDAVEDGSLDFDEANTMIDKLKLGRASGAIIGGKYITINSEQNILDSLKNGRLSAGTVFSHEIGHAIDDMAFPDTEEGKKEKAKYTELLYNYSKKNLKSSHNTVIDRLIGIGLYDTNKSFENQSEKTKDEYTKHLGDEVKANAAEKKKVLDASKEGFIEKMMNFVEKVPGVKIRDYKINKEEDAVGWFGSHIRSFEEGSSGKLTSIQKRKIKYNERKPKKVGTYNSEEASNRVQDIYEQKGGVDGAFEIIDEFKPIVNKLVEKRRGAPGFNKSDLMGEIELGHRGLYDLIQEYSAESGVPLAAYINKFLPARAIEASKRILGEEFMLDSAEARGIVAQETAEKVEIDEKVKKVYLPERLEVSQDVDQAVNKVANKDIEGKNFKTLKPVTTEVVGNLMGIPAKKIINNANLSKPELAKAQMFINQNADLLLNMLPEGHTSSGTATGVQKVLLDSFYTKSERRAKTGPGLQVQIKRKDVTKSEFLETFGIIEGKPNRDDRNTSSRVLAIAKQLDKMLTNQGVRKKLEIDKKPMQSIGLLADGKSTVMFSENIAGNLVPDIVGRLDESLTVEDRAMLWDSNKIQDFARIYLENGVNSAEGVELALRQVYNDVSGIIENSKDLSNRIFSSIEPSLPKIKVKDISKKANQLVDKLVHANRASEISLAAFTKGDSRFDVKANRKKLRALNKIFINNIFDSNDVAGSVRKIFQLLGSSGTAGKSFIKRKQLYENGPDFINDVLLSIPGVTKLGKVGARFTSAKDVEKNLYYEDESIAGINTTFFSQKSADVAKADKSKIKEINEEAKEAAEFLNEYVEFYAEQFKNNQLSNDQLNMVMSTLLSNMKSVLRRAAAVGYVVPNINSFTNPGSQLEYEHMQPAVTMIIRLFNEHINGTKAPKKPNYNKLKSKKAKQEAKQKYEQAVSDFFKNYKVAVITKEMNDAIRDAKLNNALAEGQTFDMDAWVRYYNNATLGDSRLHSLINVETGNTLEVAEAHAKTAEILDNASPKKLNDNKIITKAVKTANSSNYSEEAKGITVLDFDDTLATTKSKVKATAPDGTVINLNAEQYASDYQDLLAQGYTFDFSDFSKVVKGKIAPLFQKALKLQGKFGPENMFVLTARPVDSASAIFEFLKANGLNIPLKNITGLANSTSEAKALWVASKVTEGYNDFYFADDALANVQAVKNMLDQFDVKSKVQQAKAKFSEDAGVAFNNIIEQTFKVEAFKKFSPAKGALRGKTQGRFDIFIPPGAEDFKGLIYGLLAKGKTGEQQLEFFNETLLKPFSRASQEVDLARVQIMTDYKKLRKDMPNVRKKMNNKIGDTTYTVDNAIRVYLWNKAGFNIPGLTKTDRAKLVEAVEADSDVKAYADSLSAISKLDQGWKQPGNYWLTENIASDMTEIVNSVHRQEALTEFKENREKIFGKWQNGKLVGPNMAKLEAVKGAAYVEALNDMLWRMENGTNRNFGNDRTTNAFTNWVNGSIGAIMFFNQRSALLQLISSVNYINYDDNNPVAAARAFANQKQYWKDFAYLWNSPTLVARRAGLRGNIETSEIALAAEKGGPKAVFAYLLKLGFTPTQIADSFAISSGGAAMYRNRVNKYLKDGLTQKEAETKAFDDFNEITQENQQSSRADKISMQQAGPLGRFILAFGNTPMQYTRLMKRDIQDLINRRRVPGQDLNQSDKIRLGRIIYYGAVQNLIFGALQSAMFRFIFEEDDEEQQKKEVRVANGMMDTILRGMGVQGAVVSTLKNMVIKFIQQNNKKTFDESAVVMEFLNLSPPIGSKARKIVSAMKTLRYQKDELKHMPKLNINNPLWQVVGNLTSGITNLPLDRVVNKLANIKEAMDSDNAAWQRIALLNGWNAWDLGVTPDDLEKAREEVDVIKEAKKEAKKEATKIRKEEERLEKQRQGKFDYLTDEEVALKEKKVELVKLNKSQQVNMLMDLGLSSKDIKALKYEDDRVNKIIELTKK